MVKNKIESKRQNLKNRIFHKEHKNVINGKHEHFLVDLFAEFINFHYLCSDFTNTS